MNYAFYDGARTTSPFEPEDKEAKYDVEKYPPIFDVEYDIVGNDYKELIELCCRYSKYFSLEYFSIYYIDHTEIEKLLKPYETKVDPAQFFSKPRYYSPLASKKIFYMVCPETCKILSEHVNTLWSWIANTEFKKPEDLTFYRQDASVFLNRPFTTENAFSFQKTMRTFQRS